MKIVIIDNYDSFTYNLSHLIKELGAEVTVLRNDQFKLEELEPYNKIVLSPGPGIPSEAGLLYSLMSKRSSAMPNSLASTRATSVLPTPVGPTKSSEARGLLSSSRPAFDI